MTKNSHNGLHRFKFSFVMPVYNVENYLAETIESVLAQSMDFEQNCEIILINDGSPDNSEEVCLRYQKQYPKNIKYIKQENHGVAYARNRGLDVAEGKYISFLDSDDKISPDTLKEVYDFFEEHANQIDLVAIKMKFFDAQEGEHTLNSRFTSNRIVDISKEFNCIQSAGGSTFVSLSAIGQMRFDTSLKIAEDLKFITNIILKKNKYGLVSKPTYYYRRREGVVSATSQSRQSKHWYTEIIKGFHEYFVELSRSPENVRSKKYLQYLIMYESQWRFMQREATILSRRETNVYKSRLLDIIRHIDDEIILAQRNIQVETKLFIIAKKHNISLSAIEPDENGKCYLGKTLLYGYQGSGEILIDLIEVNKDVLVIEGKLKAIVFGGVKFGFSINGNFREVTKTARPNEYVKFFDELVFDRNSFKISIKIKSGDNIVPEIRTDSGYKRALPVSYSFLARMGKYNGYRYKTMDGFLLCHIKPCVLVIVDNTFYRSFVKEARLIMYLLKKMAIYTVLFRLAYYALAMFYHKKIWLFCDRKDLAGDNAEQLMKYVHQESASYIKPIFAISKSSSDFARLRRHYKVVDQDGLYYKLLFLHADKLISSHADRHVVLNCLGDKYESLSDLINFDFVFLSHGINKQDVSNLYGKYNINAKIYTVVGQPEYDSMLDSNYGYTKKEVALTGFARYDRDYSKPKNKIVIAPTWRNNLVKPNVIGTHRRNYNPEFKKSEFYGFYQSFLSDKRFIKILKDNNLICEFLVHPSFRQQAEDLIGNRYVRVVQPPLDYNKILGEAKLLITDYSGVAFDFAFLNRPVIYTQFDKDTFYECHTFKEGYFSYENDGFGPVTNNLDQTLNQISKLIDHDFVMPKKYANRLKDFFVWFDHNNCQRIYQSILNINPDIHYEKVIKRSFRNRLIGRSNQDKLPIRAFWWRYKYPVQLNFGDEITPYIIKSIWDRDCVWTDPSQADLAGAGSIIEILQRRSNGNNIKVWGSGFISKGDDNSLENLDFYAVRGPSSLSRITTDHDVALGDPGILASLVFRRAKKKIYKVGVVAHYVDKSSVALEKIIKNPDYLIIDPLQTPDKVALDITSCEYVLSSSLHGLIFADSFGVPNNWMPLSDNVTGGSYKFDDYYLSTGRETIKELPSILGNQKAIGAAIAGYKTIPHLRKMQRTLIKSFPFK